MLYKLLLVLLCLFPVSLLATQNFDYQLKPIEIAVDTYVLVGETRDFSVENGGNILNTGFIITEQGVIVIDAGPSFIYGLQMRKAISQLTDKPVIKVLLTHHHPDHIFGVQAFKDSSIFALEATVNSIKNEAGGLLDNLYRMVGYWMKDTEVMDNIKILDRTDDKFGNHELEYIAMSGHTSSDLIVYDKTTGVLFTGDLVFHNRALTTPHADPEKWQTSLNALKNMEFNILVPGHGAISQDKAPIEQTLDYLTWLESSIESAVRQGKDMNEAMNVSVPERFNSLDGLQRELSRSITHRYPYYENKLFQ